MDLQNGTIVNGHYRIVGSAPIGRGGFSEVWKAVDVMTGVEVVLKIYAPGTGLDAEGLEVLKREFALVFQLNHNNLLKATHFDIIEGKIPFLVMPYCPGSCADVRQAFPEREVFRFLRDVAAGLEFLHERDIVHQDIKPANILIDASGQYVITDFGISTRVRNTLRKSATQQKSSEGTIAYMAPERFGRDNMPVKASDVWSLGVTVFELIAGYVPFGEHGGLMQKNGAEIPEIPGDYSPELKMLVTACLAPQPWNRPLASQIREYAGYGLQGQNQKIAEALQGKVTTAGETAAAPKKRNKFISFWLGLMITLNTLGACFMLYGLLTEDMYGGTWMTVSMSFTLNVLCALMLWKWMRWGYWLYIFSAVFVMVDDLISAPLDMLPTLVGGVIGLLILYGILNLKKNGIPAWKQMDYSFHWKEHRGMYGGFIALLAGIFLIGIVKMQQEPTYTGYSDPLYGMESDTTFVSTEEYPATQTMLAKDGSCSVIVPDFFVKQDLNDGAILSCGLNDDHPYVTVMREKKVTVNDYGLTTLAKYTDYLTDQMKQQGEIMDYRQLSRENTTVNGASAILIKFEGKVSIGSLNVKMYWEKYYIEGKDSYYQLVICTINSKKEESKELIQEIGASFQEIV